MTDRDDLARMCAHPACLREATGEIMSPADGVSIRHCRYHGRWAEREIDAWLGRQAKKEPQQ